MKKKFIEMKKKLALTIVTTIVLSTLAGCGGSNNNTSNTDSNSETVSSENFNETGYPIVNEKITLDAILIIRDVDSLSDPDTMKMVQDLEEKTGIHVNWEIMKGSDADTKINLMFASGDYPDFILSTNNLLDYEEYGASQGILLPVDELVEKYMPTYTERIAAEESDPTVSLIASDGKKYTVGAFQAQNIRTAQDLFINQEWLDALGLKMPETFDELNDTLRAFKTGDPNGNGLADEIPVELCLQDGFYSARSILPMFGVPVSDSGSWAYIDDNKKVQFGATTEGYRKCLEWLNMLYTEGLIDPELISQDINTVESKITQGNVGLIPAWRLKAMGWDDSVVKTHTLFMPTPPEGEEVSFYRYLEVAKPGAYITVANENIPATMRLFDTLLETETQASFYFGEEGTGWAYNSENSKIDVIGEVNAEVKTWFDTNSLFFGPAEYMVENFNRSEQREEKTDNSRVYEDAGFIQKYSNKYLLMSPLSSEELAPLNLTETDIKNAVMENQAGFVTNGVTNESWNAYLDVINKIGVEKYLATYQNALDKMDLE